MKRFFANGFLWLLIAVIAAGYAAGGYFATRAYPADATEDSIPLVIVMYHSILKDPGWQGKFVVSPAQLEQDIAYLAQKGYQAVNFADLIAYVDNGTPLPEKAVMLTFDDGYYNNFLYAYPLLLKSGFKAVISPIGKYSDLYTEKDETNAYYSHIKWQEAAEMVHSGKVELQNHSYDMHSNRGNRKGSHKMQGESVENYRSVLYADMKKAHDAILNHTGTAPVAYVYPFGNASAEAKEVLFKMNYRASLSCEEGINHITRSPDCLFFLKRYNRPAGKSAEVYFSSILEKAERTK